MDMTDFKKCEKTPGCKTMVVYVSGQAFQRKQVGRNMHLVPHNCYVPPEAQRPDVIYFSEWQHTETRRKRYSQIRPRINDLILRAPDVDAHHYRLYGNQKSKYFLVGIYKSTPNWTMLTDEEIKELNDGK